MQVLRELEFDDLSLPKVSLPARRTLDRITALHHAKARMLAQGIPATAVAAALGCSVSGLSSLRNDPTFQELYSYYCEQFKELELDNARKYALVGRQALDALSEKIEKEGSELTVRELLLVAGDAMDRTDLPKKQGTQQAAGAATITFNFGKLDSGKVIDGEIEGSDFGK